MQMNQAVHSDFLVHWTGKDIDRNDRRWDSPKYRMTEATAVLFADRLASILTNGFWMMREPARKVTVKPHRPITIPEVTRTSFTALKLSASRQHAHSYGRLGIAVKRPYVIRRQGRELVYYAYSDRTTDPFLYACLSDLKDRAMLGYFQPMNRKNQTRKSGKMTFDLYSETEWRIVHRPELDAEGFTVKPPIEWDTWHIHPERLLPLDGWLAMIIYPSIEVKALCQEAGSPVLAAIKAIKSRDDHGNRVEPKNWPAEINLDDCRYF